MAKKALTDAPEVLEPKQKARLLVWLKAKYPGQVKVSNLRWEECRDWHLKKGERCANWEAAYRMWVRNHVKFKKRDHRKRHPQPGDPEMPQQEGARGDDLESLDKLLH